jgi:hypothetical protein
MIKLKNNNEIREKITLVNKKIFCCHIGGAKIKFCSTFHKSGKCLDFFIKNIINSSSNHHNHTGDQYESIFH